MRKEAKAIKAITKLQFLVNVELNQLTNESMICFIYSKTHIKIQVFGTQWFGPKSLCPLCSKTELWAEQCCPNSMGRIQLRLTSPVSALTARFDPR